MASDFGLDGFFDDGDVWVALLPDDPIFACLATLPMGWNWALHFCHAVCVRAMVVAARRAFQLSDVEAAGQLLLDGRPPPELGPNRPVLAPYVDNCNAITWDADDASKYCHALTGVLTEFGLAHRVECHGLSSWPTLGIIFDAEGLALTNQPRRL